MKKRVLISFGAVGVLAAAAPTLAGVGSAISSFHMTGTSEPYALGIYRDAEYVYAVLYSSGPDYLRSYTTAGSPVGSVALSGATTPRDAGHSSYGTGYFAVLDGDRILHYVVSTGSLVASTGAPRGARGLAYIPGGPYVYVGANRIIYVLTTTGSLVRSINVGVNVGALAATRYFEDRSGEYLLVATWGSGMPTYVYGVSPIRSFIVPGTTNGCVCGPGAPSRHGVTYLCNQYLGAGMYAYQIDLGNSDVAVVPASVGKVKALYR